jgi:uncharacterized membrane protein YtjA (UPF0391 family)
MLTASARQDAHSRHGPFGALRRVGTVIATDRVSPYRTLDEELIMLHYAVVFLVIALIAAVFGFGGIAAGAAGIAKILFFVFLVLFVVSLIAGGGWRRGQ